jgi:hypothetical protein
MVCCCVQGGFMKKYTYWRTAVPIVLALLLMFFPIRLVFADQSLSDIVVEVKNMLNAGKPRREIAQFINQTVDSRIVSLNRDTQDENKSIQSSQYTISKEAFDAWSREGVDVDDPYAAAHWAWQNKIGHCQENAHTAYHILMMALQDGAGFGEFACGDHIYVIWGIPKGFTGGVDIATLNSWDDAYIIDPWLGICKSTKDVGRLDLTLTKAGLYSIDRVANWSYSTYKRKYDAWLKMCEDFSGNYGTVTDKLIVTGVSGQSNISVGQIMNTKPAGVFKVSQEGNEVTVTFRAAKVTGSAVGRIALLTDVISGNVTYITLSKITIGGKKKLKVLLKTKNPNTGSVIIREGILTAV